MTRRRTTEDGAREAKAVRLGGLQCLVPVRWRERGQEVTPRHTPGLALELDGGLDSKAGGVWRETRAVARSWRVGDLGSSLLVDLLGPLTRSCLFPAVSL